MNVAKRRRFRRGLAGLTSIGYLVSAAALQSQGTVKVVDTRGAPVPYAAVQLGGAAERAADTLGIARLSKGSPKRQQLRVRRIGFAPFVGEVTPSPDGVYHVVLNPAVNGLDAVRTFAVASTPLSRTGFYERMDRVHNGAMVGEFITPEEIDARRPSLITQLMRGRRYVGVTRGKDNKPLLTGRGGFCGMTILMDGVRQNKTLEEFGRNQPQNVTVIAGANKTSRPELENLLSLDEIVGVNEVMAIEIYPSSANAPAELIPLTGTGTCGIVAIWTGPRR